MGDAENERSRAVPPLVIDSVKDPTPPVRTNRPILFREREGWCPYSERVWLALEICHVDYDTVRIDNSGYGLRPSYFTNRQTPQIMWPGSQRMQGESADLVRRIFAEYGRPTLQAHHLDRHEVCLGMWKEIMPQRSRPSSRAAFLFQSNGEPLGELQLRKTLRSVDDMIQRFHDDSGDPHHDHDDDGPIFMTGDHSVGPADVFWAPFLERYRYQLPCLHEGLDPNDVMEFPYLARWYQTMDENVAAYSCRVKGNAASWRKVLSMAGFGNAGVPPTIRANMNGLIAKEEYESRYAMEYYGPALWREYAKRRPYLAQQSPSDQAALTIVQNHNAIMADAWRRCSDGNGTNNDPTLWATREALEADLKALVVALLSSSSSSSSNNNNGTTTTISHSARRLAQFLTERMCVPRDMGCLPAAALHVLSLEPQ
jgi:glutathione S-transferase